MKKKQTASSSRLPLVWASHIRDSEASEKFKGLVQGELLGNKVIERLRDLVVLKLDVIESEIKSDDQFDKPSWAAWRANADGKRTALIDVLTLIGKPKYDE